MVVAKFGGSSLADTQKIKKAAENFISVMDKNGGSIAVVSACGNFTDEAIRDAYSINPNPSKAILDFLLCCGEQQSASYFAMALEEKGFKAFPLTGATAGINVKGEYGNAAITYIDKSFILNLLKDGIIPVVTGFQGTDNGNLKTLGRGGSDITAVEISNAFGANNCYIFTDVDGVFDKDPKKFKDAKRFDRLTHNEMTDIAQRGAKVMNLAAAKRAQQENVKLIILSSFSTDGGTVVEN